MNAKPPKTVLWKFDLTESKSNFPKNVEMVGIKRAPQRTRVAETGLVTGGRSFSTVDSVREVWVAMSNLKGGILLITGILLIFFLIKFNTASSQRIILPKSRATGMAGRPISKIRGSACSIMARPSFCPITCMTVMAP